MIILDKELYLKRFNATSKEPNLNNLTELQNLHLQHIPFENLDVIRRVPIYLNLSTIYDKVVSNNRGGFCYELNGLFHALLNELGYASHLVAATVLRPNGEWAKADTHAAILVHLEEPYLVDVGFGANTPRLPIPLSGDSRTAIGNSYRIRQHDAQTFDLIYKTASNERTLYRFSNKKKELVDFHEGCIFNQVSIDSTFTHTDIITLATASGRLTLMDRTFSEHENGISKKSILSAVEKKHVLQKSFNICLPEEE